MRRLALVVATAGGLGYFPVAPGTVGSAVGLVVFGLLEMGRATLTTHLAAILIVGAVGVWAAGITERHFGAVDPGPVVIDEVLGMLITLAFVPVAGAGMLAGFVCFRVCDIIKPFPAARLERLPGGWGVMADDAMAAIYANLALRTLVWIAPGWLT
jgi:phosphatidylglycerophosphatase A